MNLQELYSGFTSVYLPYLFDEREASNVVFMNLKSPPVYPHSESSEYLKAPPHAPAPSRASTEYPVILGISDFKFLIADNECQ